MHLGVQSLQPQARGEPGGDDRAAHAQIEAKRYAAALQAKGVAPERIRAYGMAFRGKEVLIG